MSAAAWDELEREADAWREEGRPLTLWWRDDDAAAPCPALSSLLALAGPECPLGLAVIPEPASPALADEVAPLPEVDVLVHGFAHENHADAGARKSEYPAGREQAAAAEFRAGRERLVALFGDRALPVFVPPWNRMDAAPAALLSDAGYCMLSGFRGNPPTPAALARLDTHVDLIDWRGGRCFAGEEAVLEPLVAALDERRQGDDERPTGVLTHHQVHDAHAWRFLERLLAWGAQAPGVRWTRPRAIASSFDGG